MFVCMTASYSLPKSCSQLANSNCEKGRNPHMNFVYSRIIIKKTNKTMKIQNFKSGYDVTKGSAIAAGEKNDC